MTIEDIADATSNDKELRKFRKCLTSESGTIKELHQFENAWNELSFNRESVIFRGHRILIHKNLQERVVELANGGHQGIVRTKNLLRSRVWLHKMD